MSFKLDSVSERHLIGVHPDLVKVVRDCAQNGTFPATMTFGVTEGLRTLAQQKLNVDHHVSWTLHSRHLTGHAVDLAVLFDGRLSWAWPPYDTLADQMKEAAARVRVPLEWGGDWTLHKDGPHFQLPTYQYPPHEDAAA